MVVIKGANNVKDEELIYLRNKIIIAIVVALVFSIPLFIFVYRNFHVEEDSLISSIKNKETILIFVERDSCDRCNGVLEILDQNQVDYHLVNADHMSHYTEMIRLVGISDKYVKVPGLIYLKDGELVANMMDIRSQTDLSAFLSEYHLRNTKASS